MGALLGLAASSRGAVKWKSIAGLSAAVVLSLAGSTVFWPWVNLTAYAEPEVERAGLEALDRNDAQRAVKLLEISTRMRQAPTRAWYNLGIAYQHLRRYDDALTAYEHAAQMPDGDSKMQKAAQEMKDYCARRKEFQKLEQGFGTDASPATPNTQANQ
jgi:Tetratricopeptide repeat.